MQGNMMQQMDGGITAADACMHALHLHLHLAYTYTCVPHACNGRDAQVFDGLQSACAGAFRGMGRNALVALLNFVGK